MELCLNFWYLPSAARDAGCVQAPPCESSPEKAAPVLTIRNNHPYL